MSGTRVQPNDVLLNITGASIGRCAVVPEDFAEGNVSQHVAIIRLFLPEIRHFLHLALTSPSYQQLIDSVQVGVSREGLSMQRLRVFPMPVPPLAEQRRIVAKVDELMALCDRLEAAQAERERRRDRFTVSTHRRIVDRANHESLTGRNDLLAILTQSVDQVGLLRATILRLAVQGRLDTGDTSDESADIFLGYRSIVLELHAAPWPIPARWAWSSLS